MVLEDVNHAANQPLASKNRASQWGMTTPQRRQWAPCDSGRHSKGGGCVSWGDVKSFLDMASAVVAPGDV